MVDLFGVLGGDDDVRNADGLSVLVNDGDLRLRVGAKPRRLPAFANASELTAEAMSKHDRCRHQLGRIVAGEPEHQALVARALFRGLLSFCLLRVDALRNVSGLAGDDVLNKETIGVKNIVIVYVTDLANRIADDLDVIEIRL